MALRRYLTLPLHGVQHLLRFGKRSLELSVGTFDQDDYPLSLDVWQNYDAATPSVEKSVRHSPAGLVHSRVIGVLHTRHIAVSRLTHIVCYVHAEDGEASGTLLTSLPMVSNQWIDMVELRPGLAPNSPLILSDSTTSANVAYGAVIRFSLLTLPFLITTLLASYKDRDPKHQ
jgi:hypothetical protein